MGEAVAVAVVVVVIVVIVVIAAEVFVVVPPTEHSVQLSRPAVAHDVACCCCEEEACSVAGSGDSGREVGGSGSGGGAHLYTHSVHFVAMLRSTDIHSRRFVGNSNETSKPRVVLVLVGC